MSNSRNDNSNKTISQVAPASASGSNSASGDNFGNYATGTNVAPSGAVGNSGTPGNPNHPIAPEQTVTAAATDTKIVPVDDTAAAGHVAEKHQEVADKLAAAHNANVDSAVKNARENKPKEVKPENLTFRDPADIVNSNL